MTPRNVSRVLLIASACAVLTGCMPKMTIEQMKAEMPKRPAELDRLNDFIGKWKGEGTATFAFLDEPITSSGTSEASWDESGWFIVERGEFTMADFDPMRMIATWTYDTKGKKYRSTWTDSMGSIGTGTARYDEKSNTWHMKASSYSPFGKSSMKGSVTFVDPDTMEWTWTEYMGLSKTAEMTGTHKRQK